MKLYVCGVDWEHEINHVPHRVGFFKTIIALKRAKKCWRRCGIVELSVKESKWVVKQNLTESLTFKQAMRRGLK